MKNMFNILFLALALCSSAGADCFRNSSGDVVCGGGQCEIDQYGKVYCAQPGGGAIRDQHGNVVCGTGYCAKDSSANVWCSKKPGGGAAVDLHGKVKCLGGCEAGSAKLCQEGQP